MIIHNDKKAAKNGAEARLNYEKTKKAVGYVPRKKATQKDYDRIGFMSGLEVHQQLKTSEKLFCHCPAGIYQKPDDFDAEVIRHMRPTLSELGEYDGTALMEFKTRKKIVYHLKNETACTYEVDDTPPFHINQEALKIAMEISLLTKLNIVGEVHITRKQYLDGSIPTGFQRTAIVGVEGEIPLKNKKVRVIQLSVEEDSCREVSDIGHTRVYRTDRLGMPLIETVTYPDMTNPDEVKEACDYIRFLNRSTGHVRTGMGAGREDVNVSCKGGTRIEIKGVAHTKWIPELTHNECYRQWALLQIKNILNKKISDKSSWKISSKKLNFYDFKFDYEPLINAKNNRYKIYAVNMPKFKGILSHFTQPGKTFTNEITDRLKVIACLEKPNMTSSEELQPVVEEKDFNKIRQMLNADSDDAQLIFWGPEEDIETALETIEERCLMAFDGVPEETRKYLDDGTTIFERVLPGADRMYPDTDTAPIPVDEAYIENIKKNLPTEIIDRYKQLKKWKVPEDTFTYIFKKNLFLTIKKIVQDLKIDPRFVCTFFGHTFKFVETHYITTNEFSVDRIYDMFKYLLDNNIDLAISKRMISVVYQHPKMDFDSVLISMKFKKILKEDIISEIPYLKKKFAEIRISQKDNVENKWIMGQLNRMATGNMPLKDLYKIVNNSLK